MDFTESTETCYGMLGMLGMLGTSFKAYSRTERWETPTPYSKTLLGENIIYVKNIFYLKTYFI